MGESDTTLASICKPLGLLHLTEAAAAVDLDQLYGMCPRQTVPL